ncbi:hypothetical protein WAI453_008008 [Rhynchosporium graminicola]
MRFVTFIFFGLSAFALTQAKKPGLDGDKCTWPNDCKSGCCLAKQQVCQGSGKMNDKCWVSKKDSCNTGYICSYYNTGDQYGVCR